MVSISAVRDNNSHIARLYGPGLVAVFVGGTSGIGESTARAFIHNTDSPRVYLIGRDQTRASQIIDDLRQVKPDGRVEFIASDVSLLSEVDAACRRIQETEEKVNLLFLSPGVLTMKGPDETSEGLDKKLSLHYYARMRFVANLLPQLTKASNNEATEDKTPSLSRVISVLDAGGEASLNLTDLPLKTHYSLKNCAQHAITMNSLAMEHLASAASHPQTSFVHSFPGIVRTRLARGLGSVTRLAVNALMVLTKPWEVSLEESGERHLYAATSPRFAPGAQASGAGVSRTDDVAEGSDGRLGSGFYRLAADGETFAPSRVLQQYREDGTREMVWKHTVDLFASVRDERS